MPDASRYNLSAFQSGTVVSSSLLGALAGSGGAFAFGDRLGRRGELLLAAVLYGAGIILHRFADLLLWTAQHVHAPPSQQHRTTCLPACSGIAQAVWQVGRSAQHV